MKNMFYFLFIRIHLSILLFSNCHAVITDSSGVVLPEVVSIFRCYKPLIEAKKRDICEKYALSEEHIDNLCDPDVDCSAIPLTVLNSVAQLGSVNKILSEPN